jgi:hypothetical protein
MRKIGSCFAGFLISLALLGCKDTGQQDQRELLRIKMVRIPSTAGVNLFDMRDRAASGIILDPNWARQPQDRLVVDDLQVMPASWSLLIHAAAKIHRQWSVAYSEDLAPACLVTLSYEGGVERNILFLNSNRHGLRWFFSSRAEEQGLAVALAEVTGHSSRSHSFVVPSDQGFLTLANDYDRNIASAEIALNQLRDGQSKMSAWLSGLDCEVRQFSSVMKGTREQVSQLLKAQPAARSHASAQ